MKTRMSEAEVSLILAHYLVATDRVVSDVSVAIDGAQVRTGVKKHCDVRAILESIGWKPQKPGVRWQGVYYNAGFPHCIILHSRPGSGDVVATLKSGKQLIVESKKGPLAKSSNSCEYKLIREALGQIMTIPHVPKNAMLAVAVPHGERFVQLVQKWRSAPLVKRARIRLLTVSSSTRVTGF
jgi:hypothetical protein